MSIRLNIRIIVEMKELWNTLQMTCNIKKRICFFKTLQNFKFYHRHIQLRKNFIVVSATRRQITSCARQRWALSQLRSLQFALVLRVFQCWNSMFGGGYCELKWITVCLCFILGRWLWCISSKLDIFGTIFLFILSKFNFFLFKYTKAAACLVKLGANRQRSHLTSPYYYPSWFLFSCSTKQRNLNQFFFCLFHRCHIVNGWRRCCRRSSQCLFVAWRHKRIGC